MPHQNLLKILFLDIETVRAKKHFEELAEDWQHLWADKTKFQRKEEIEADAYYLDRAGILAEFGKIICISCGFFVEQEGSLQFRIRSFSGHDEKQLLQDFQKLLNHHYYKDFALCAHNGKEFDFPYIARRMLAHGLTLPMHLDIGGLKPWEIPHIDTMELWKFGDYKHYTSLKLLAALFDIPTPKDDIDGSMVGSVYWDEEDLDRIVRYCEKDTTTVARVYMRLRMLGTLADDQIVYG